MPVNYLLELAFPKQCLWYVVSLSTICVRAACNNWTGLHNVHAHTNTNSFTHRPLKQPHNPPPLTGKMHYYAAKYNMLSQSK